MIGDVLREIRESATATTFSGATPAATWWFMNGPGFGNFGRRKGIRPMVISADSEARSVVCPIARKLLLGRKAAVPTM
jgi:hypothetical protein